MVKLLLASSSIYRKELLSRLKIPFTTFSPEVDESHLPGEPWETMVLRLSEEKALCAAKLYPDSVCIGSDAVAALDHTFFGKPLTHEVAKAQLAIMSDQVVTYYTGVCVAAPFLHYVKCKLVPTKVKFRPLSAQIIENYLLKEKPYYSAGSFKSETLGSALIEHVESEDPTAIIGLPLISLCDMLSEVGITIL